MAGGLERDQQQIEGQEQQKANHQQGAHVAPNLPSMTGKTAALPPPRHSQHHQGPSRLLSSHPLAPPSYLLQHSLQAEGGTPRLALGASLHR